LRAEGEAQQERRRREAALGRAEAVEPAAVPGVPERQLAEAADCVDGRALGEGEHLRVAKLVEPCCRGQHGPYESRGEHREEGQADGRAFGETSHAISVVKWPGLAGDRPRASRIGGVRALGAARVDVIVDRAEDVLDAYAL